jgi:hypothetical protein
MYNKVICLTLGITLPSHPQLFYKPNKREINETLANFIKQSTQQRGERRNKERGLKSEPPEQNPKWVITWHRNKSCSKVPTTRKEHISERDWNLRSKFDCIKS